MSELLSESLLLNDGSLSKAPTVSSREASLSGKWGCEEAPAERSSGAGSSVADSRATPSGLPSDAQTPTNWPDLDSSGLKALEATDRLFSAAWNGDPGS